MAAWKLLDSAVNKACTRNLPTNRLKFVALTITIQTPPTLWWWIWPSKLWNRATTRCSRRILSLRQIKALRWLSRKRHSQLIKWKKMKRKRKKKRCFKLSARERLSPFNILYMKFKDLAKGQRYTDSPSRHLLSLIENLFSRPKKRPQRLVFTKLIIWSLLNSRAIIPINSWVLQWIKKPWLWMLD